MIEDVFLKSCVNGVRSRTEHPALPVTAAELGRVQRGSSRPARTLPDGTPAPDNAALVTAARTVGAVP